MRFSVLISFLSLCTFLHPACTNDPQQPTFDKNKLIGRWELEAGFRNGKKTETLTGTYFEFLRDGKMKTNLTPTVSEEEYVYSVDGNIISQKGDPATIYTIDSLSDTQLRISMTISNFPFKVILKKALAAEEGEDQGIMQ